MALRYGYFDSEIIGVDDEGMPIFDRAETSDLFALFFSGLVSDGVLARPSNCFQVLGTGSGMEVEIQPGFGMVKGHFAYNNEKMKLGIEPAPRKYSRIDRVIMRCNYLDRLVEIVVKTGAEAANPVPPGLTRPAAGDYFELCLANIKIAAGQKIITQSSISDTRPDSRVCGYITQLIDHLDTDVFFAQFDAFYAEFVKKSNGSYDKFVADMQKFLNGLENSGNTQLKQIIDAMRNFEVTSEQEFTDWFDSIKGVLESAVNGEMLAEILRLMKDLYNMANQADIDRILNEKYVDIEDTDGIFETATTSDIDDIIKGSYVEQDDSDNILTEVNVETIVNGAFREV
ncbi:MAG: hypothetical protein HFI51_16350 [Lachnospiraceae bacterium]|jgi:hypothetical protein|nr:hypothetical protein [Lachnospiraceae bacterium]